MSDIEKSFSTEKYVVSHPVREEHDGQRLDQFVMKCMPTLSREFLKRKIERGEIEISGRRPPHKPSVKVHAGERVTITTHNDGMIEEEYWHGEVVPKTEPPTVIFEDEGLIVVNKPPYMITHPAGRNLFYCATVFFETIHKKTIHSIHRLDRETSGVLLLAKNPMTAQKIGALFEMDLVRKCYFFIAHKKSGAVDFPFTARERLGRKEGAVPESMMFCFPESAKDGKESETHFELLLEKDGFVLVLAFPLTGRQHQIRVHAANHGYPLLGDKMYNGDPTVFMRFKDNEATPVDHEKMEIPRQALHAAALKILYKDRPTHFIAPIPKDLAQWLDSRLGLDLKTVESLMEKKIVEFLS